MANQYTTVSKSGLEYLCKCINLTASIPELLNDVLPSQQNVYSSYKVTELLNTLQSDLQAYVNSAIGNLSHLKKEIVSTAPTADTAEEDTIYLVQDANGGYEQYLLINGVVTSLGSTSAMANVYTKSESDAKFALQTTLKSLVDAVGGLNDLTTTDKTSIVNAINELKTGLDEALSSKGLIALTKAQYEQLVADGSVTVDGETITYSAEDFYVIPDDVDNITVTSTINSTSTDTEVPSAKAVNDTCVHIDAENMMLKCVASGTAFTDYVDENCTNDFRAYHIVFNSLVSGTPCTDGFGTIYNFHGSLHKKAVIYDVITNAVWELTKLNGTWGTWQRVRSAVEDVPLTGVTLPDGISGSVFYKISNGIIIINIQGVTANCSVTIPNVPNVYQLSALVNPSGVQCGYVGVSALNTIAIVINGSNAGYGSIIINT